MWLYVELCGTRCSYVELCGRMWTYVGLCGARCNYVELSGRMWDYMDVCGAMPSSVRLRRALEGLWKGFEKWFWRVLECSRMIPLVSTILDHFGTHFWDPFGTPRSTVILGGFQSRDPPGYPLATPSIFTPNPTEAWSMRELTRTPSGAMWS